MDDRKKNVCFVCGCECYGYKCSDCVQKKDTNNAVRRVNKRYYWRVKNV